MRTTTIRRTIAGAVIVVAAAGAAAALGTSGGTDVTRARLERDLPATFANLYVQQARILGHTAITVASLHARAQCDKGGPKVADHGPGADWICFMSWRDPNVSLAPDGYSKFELNVHSNDCYTAGGPSKIVGPLTITDLQGRDVPNPVFEFDSCFDPHGSNAPTGVVFPPPTTTPGSTGVPSGGSSTATPATLTLGPGRARLHDGAVRIPVSCSAGDGGCGGTVRLAPGGRSVTYALAAGDTSTLSIPGRWHGTTRVTATVRAIIGGGPAVPTVLAVAP